ncbi:Subtilisin-like serine protease [Blastococcus saxobsidens DD2]|uniref:Subtilisin-like serine protease n=1 Tax=Blastococcus saxobsidens (strain DD2) TaxID=1146883 RepID=H6RN61_BLASD|nr:Subtilisin-like serine protease [Blastococcus saxobsidens DD2]
MIQPESTGRQIVVFADEEDAPGVDWGLAGISEVADSRNFETGGLPSETVHDAQATVFGQLDIAVVSADPTRVSMLQSVDASGRRVLSVSPELVHHVLQDVLEYARAYRWCSGEPASWALRRTVPRSWPSARWTRSSGWPSSRPAACRPAVARSTSPGRGSRSSSRPGRCRRATARSAGRAWPLRSSPASRRCGPRRPGVVGWRSGRRSASRASG